MKLCYLDYEFNNINEPKLNLVSVAAKCYHDGTLTFERTLWLYNNKTNQRHAKEFFEKLIKLDYTFVAYVMEAEARSLQTLFGEMPKFKAIDLYLEYRCLLNHNHKYAYGEQYLNGKVIKTSPPPNKWLAKEMGETEEDNEAHHKPSYSLAAATFKLLGVKIDTEEKNAVRDIIIKGDGREIEANRERILAYNASDIDYLKPLINKIVTIFRREGGETVKGWAEAAHTRGEYSVLSAKMLARGYPVNHDKVKSFTLNISHILNEAVQHCFTTAPDVEAFRWAKKDKKWTLYEKPIRAWVEAQNLPHWRKTDKGKLSLSKDAFNDWFSQDSEGFAGAFCRYLKTKQSLNGFIPSQNAKKGVFSDFVGSDGRVRPYLGIYGSQASRSQPGSIGFIPLKAHWMRNFIEAPKGRALAGIDYASQEFLIAAIMSQDSEMMDAYKSGDVYLAFGKSAGLIPKNGTKATHKKERDMCKTLVLGISYDLSENGLAPRLTRITGQEWTKEQARELIDLFYEVYSDYKDWKEAIRYDYVENKFLQLSDGWTMWGDNDNMRSVGNFPVQGTGAVIMRKAVKLCDDAGIDVVFTLHDALYIEFDSYNTLAVTKLMSCMSQAFETVMQEFGTTIPIRLEGEMWSKDYADKMPDKIENVVALTEYVDDKGRADLERYRKFLTATISNG